MCFFVWGGVGWLVGSWFDGFFTSQLFFRKIKPRHRDVTLLAQVSTEERDVGVNMVQCWPESNSQRWVLSGPSSAALPNGSLFCFIYFSSLMQDKSPTLIFMLILKLDLRVSNKFMKSPNSADCGLPMAAFTELLGNSSNGIISHNDSLSLTGGFLVLLHNK